MTSVRRKLIVRVASAISRLATSHVGWSRAGIGDLLGGVYVGAPADHRQEHLGEAAAVEREVVHRPGAARRVQRDRRPLGGGAVARAARSSGPARC